MSRSHPTAAILIWGALIALVGAALVASMLSPLLAWRGPVYIISGLAGVAGMGLMLFQPLLAGGLLPGLTLVRARRLHRFLGAALVAAVLVHVIGLWIVSAPDVIDALLFMSPTPFSAWGVIAMWAVFAAAALAAFRKPLKLRPATWRLVHTALAVVTVICVIVHALLIDGTMEVVTKILLSFAVGAATLKVAADLRAWSIRPRR